jgi:hypothetical protein
MVVLEPSETLTMQSIENKTFDEIRVGDTASAQRTFQAGDVRAWATAFGEIGLFDDSGVTTLPISR